MKLQKTDLIFLFVLSLIGLYSLISFMFPNTFNLIITSYEIVVSFSLFVGYPGAFVISLLGNATILFPFPYIGVPFILGGIRDGVSGVFLYDPIIIGIVAGIGATIGEMTGYLIGYAGGCLLDQENVSGFRRYADSHPRSIPLLIWFLAATPIPDDVLLVPLGASKYHWMKVLIPQLIGKIMFLLTIAWAGRFGLDWIGELILSSDPLNWMTRITEIVAILMVVIVIYLMIRFDWNKHATSS
ncbi:MAG: conserved membrane protein of unknown function [Candidatus Thorarchaeota archaeon]|nr:MAG: conserved membrane protein of unknown function [Candidatus Thorarchaeota archaeon]